MDIRHSLIQKIKEEYQAGKLKVPSLPEVALKIREAIKGEDKSTFQIAKIIQLDPMLTTRLIHVANSPVYRGSKKIEDCHNAVNRLGLKTTQAMVTSFAVQQVYVSKHAKVRKALQLNWRHSSHVAAICYVLGRVTPAIQPDKALLAGLVHDIGVLPVLRYVEEYPAVLDNPEGFKVMLRKVTGALGRLVLKSWGMEEEIIKVPEQVYNWNYQADQAPDYVDMVIVSHVHSQYNSDGNSNEHPPLDEITSFKKLPIAQFGEDAGLELVQGARDEISEIMRMIVQ